MITKSFAVKRIILTVLVGVSMLLLPFRRRNQIYPISYQIKPVVPVVVYGLRN